jgi:hypothetical protein
MSREEFLKAKQVARERVLFKRPEGGWQNPGRVMLNWSRDPIGDLERIAEGYQLVAHDRIEILKSAGRLYPGDEIQAYPIVFLYRQAFELSLKAIVFAGAVLLRDLDEEPMAIGQVMKHDLMPLFREVSKIFDHWTDGDERVWDFNHPELRTRSNFERIVREFDEVDKGSYTFRYSVKTDGTTPSLAPGFEFDLFAFAETMDCIIPLMLVRPEMIREEMQERWQAAYEAQQEEWANADYDPGDYDPGDYDPDHY